MMEALQACRHREGCEGEIHFSELPAHFQGRYGARARVARCWLRKYGADLYQHAFFSCLMVNRKSPRFEHRRFSQSYHAYNRFTAMAIKAGVSFQLAPLGFKCIELTIVSDAKDRKSRPDQGFEDNFERYIPYRVELDNYLARQSVGGAAYPVISVTEVRTVNSSENDFLQLTDLLLGALQAALSGRAGRETKRTLARMVYDWCVERAQGRRRHRGRNPRGRRRGSSRFQEVGEEVFRMDREFNVWGFPDAHGRPFSVDLSLFAIANSGSKLFPGNACEGER